MEKGVRESGKGREGGWEGEGGRKGVRGCYGIGEMVVYFLF